ncbi:protein of unknown function [Hyphomicrobium sp. 1Nfss2.1]|uniref:hypothetical protein n=1 Tax=Hyphomicrobium sp. 1Nfss2.1 TaxID=3413936 RepID=UPI003C7B8812
MSVDARTLSTIFFLLTTVLMLSYYARNGDRNTKSNVLLFGVSVVALALATRAFAAHQ